MRRGAILEAAIAEFAEKGYVHAKLEDIARRAEFGKGTLYNYFKGGKQGMLFAIFDTLFDDMESITEQSFAEERMAVSTFRQAFYDYTLSCLSFYLDRKDLFLILVKEAHRMCFGDDQDRAAYFRDRQERLIKALTTPVDRAMERGQLRRMDAMAVAHMILGNIQGMQVHVILEQGEHTGESTFNPEKAARFLTNMLLDGLSHPDYVDPHAGDGSSRHTAAPDSQTDQFVQSELHGTSTGSHAQRK